MFMPNAPRSAAKPLCISAQTLRARARRRASRGHRPLAGNFSATYSAMARVSQTAKPSSSTRIGTLPTGDSAATTALNFESAAKLSKRTMTSSNGMSNWVSITHGRIDQDE